MLKKEKQKEWRKRTKIRNAIEFCFGVTFILLCLSDVVLILSYGFRAPLGLLLPLLLATVVCFCSWVAFQEYIKYKIRYGSWEIKREDYDWPNGG